MMIAVRNTAFFFSIVSRAHIYQLMLIALSSYPHCSQFTVLLMGPLYDPLVSAYGCKNARVMTSLALRSERFFLIFGLQ